MTVTVNSPFSFTGDTSSASLGFVTVTLAKSKSAGVAVTFRVMLSPSSAFRLTEVLLSLRVGVLLFTLRGRSRTESVP